MKIFAFELTSKDEKAKLYQAGETMKQAFINLAVTMKNAAVMSGENIAFKIDTDNCSLVATDSDSDVVEIKVLAEEIQLPENGIIEI